jgi:hypothetical protein
MLKLVNSACENERSGSVAGEDRRLLIIRPFGTTGVGRSYCRNDEWPDL